MKMPHEVYLILAVLGSVLTMATVIGHVLRPPIDNLNARIRAWWVMIILVSGAVLAGRGAVTVLFAFVSFGALREFITLAPTRRSDRVALFASFLVILPAQYALVWTGWYGLFAILIPAYAFVVLPILSALSADTENFLARTAETQWGVMLCVYCVSYVPALLMLQIPDRQNGAVLLIAFLLIVTQSSDVMQYIFGKLIGRQKIAPVLSPSKTVEGFICGIASATALGALLWRITPFKPIEAAAMALIVSVIGFLGGLVMSAIKRDRGVKDWGHVIQGHGGVLDRLDSLCFSAPIFFHLARYFFAA